MVRSPLIAANATFALNPALCFLRVRFMSCSRALPRFLGAGLHLSHLSHFRGPAQSDMRGFTALADSLPPRVMIDLLNRYFDCQVPVILDHGAEVLKFMGDGRLAIFAIADNEAEACRRALAAARRVQTNIAALASSAMPGLRFGLALHIGDILYGNIGSGNRLDFTCIGPAVNFAARIEKLASQLGRAILASGEFARYSLGDFTALGEFSLAGFSAPQAVFGLEEMRPQRSG